MTYDYRCRCCNHELTVEQSIKDEPLSECPKCRVCALYRLISGSSFVLKGDGWEKDGYTGVNRTPKQDKGGK